MMAGQVRMQRKTYLAKNTALFALNSIGTKLITFFLVPIYTKAFTTAEYGGVDLVSTIATILVPIITLNIGEAVMRFSLDENAQEEKIICIGVIFAVLSFLFGTSVFLILKIFPQIYVNAWIVFLYCVSQGLYQIASCNLRGQEKLMQYAIGNIISTFLAAILNILFLLVFNWGINGYFLAYIMAFSVASIYCTVAGDLFHILKRFNFDKKLMKDMVKYSIVLVPNSLMWWIMNSSDHIMVTAMIGIEANGIYAISYKMPSILSALSTVFNQAWTYSAIHEEKSEDRIAFNNIMYNKLVRFLLIVTVLLMCIMKPFMRIYVDTDYYEAWKYTPYLLVGNFFLTMATFLSTFYTVNKDSKGFLFSGTTGAIMNIIFNALLIPVMGIHGAALATCVSYFCVFLYRVRDTRRYMKVEVFRPQYLIGYIILIATACSMFISGWIGQIILLVEVALILLLNLRFVKECLEMVGEVVGKIRHR